VWEYLSKYLNSSLPALALEVWNDARGRTKEQVVAALRGAALTPAIAHGQSTLGLRKWFGFGIKA
jgi:hypothetical protein